MIARRAILAAAAAVVAAAGGAAVLLGAKAPERAAAAQAAPVWAEVAWPFPNDPWGPGRAFRCSGAACGAETTLYLRAKAGLCDCTTGVADDEHLDRVGDVDLVGRSSAALAPGEPVTVHRMPGRRRAYTVTGPGAAPRAVLSVAFNDRCDLVVATAATAGSTPAAQEAAVLDFLNGDLVLRWAETTLGL
jgi:hypothetical protein